MTNPREPWQEPVQGELLDPGLLNLSGLEQVRAWSGGLRPWPPLAYLTGLGLGEVDRGVATFTMPASDWFLGSEGGIPLGMLAVLADPALGTSLHTMLGPATTLTTAELSLTAVRPVAPGNGRLSARGTVVHSGRRMGLSEVAVGDEAGRLVAHGTSRCVIFPPLAVVPPLKPQATGAGEETGVLICRALMGQEIGQALDASSRDSLSGLEVLRRIIAGDLPRPPLSYLTGLRLVEAAPGLARVVLPASGWLANPGGYVQGGFLAMLADAALQAAVQTVAPAGSSVASVDFKINLLRPCPPDGRELSAHGRVIHRGRSLVVATGELSNADGSTVAVATGSGQLLA